MSVNRLHSSGLARIHTSTIASTQLEGVTSISVPLAIDAVNPVADGNVHPEVAYITAVRPEISIATTDLRAWFDALSVSSNCIKTPGSETGFDVWGVAHDECDQRDLTQSTRYNLQNGLIFPVSLQADHQADAVLNFRAMGTSEGGNAPIAVTHNVTMPTRAAGDPRWTMKNQTVAGEELTGVKSVSVDFGINPIRESADGSIYPEWASVGQQVSLITMQGIDPQWLQDSVIPLLGKKGAHADTTIRLAKRADGGALEADGTAVHVTLTMNGLVFINNAFDAAGQDTGTVNLSILGTHDGTNNPIVVATQQVLT